MLVAKSAKNKKFLILMDHIADSVSCYRACKPSSNWWAFQCTKSLSIPFLEGLQRTPATFTPSTSRSERPPSTHRTSSTAPRGTHSWTTPSVWKASSELQSPTNLVRIENRVNPRSWQESLPFLTMTSLNLALRLFSERLFSYPFVIWLDRSKTKWKKSGIV